MGDKLATRADLEGFSAATATINASTTQIAMLSNRLKNNINANNNNNHNRSNPNRGGESIPVTRVCNNNHTIDTYRKSEHIHESDLEYYERRYYKKLKDGYYNFKISDAIYRCPFCYNASVVGKNQIIEDLSSSEVMETDEPLLLRFVNAAFINKPEFCNVLPPPDVEEYMRRNTGRKKKFGNEVVDKEEAEQFLYSMLGDDCDLNLAVVRDVLCQCGYDVEKASDVLLYLATDERSSNDRNSDFRVDNNADGMGFFVDYERNDSCTSLSSEGDFSDNIWGLGSYAEVLTSSKANSQISPGCTKSELPQKVLESLFNIPKSSVHDKGTVDWRNIAKKMQSLRPGFGGCPNVAEPQQPAYPKGEEYHAFRDGARQEWDSVKCYFQKAATAYTKGDRGYAAYLSDKGKEQTKIAQKADTKASHDIFVARNKDIENVITIDLHGQHVKPAMRMLKLHLLFGSYVPSVQMIRVITGCGSHGFGKSKLKQSVTKLLDEESIEWREENRGTVLIKLDRLREFSFLDADSDTDGD